MQEVQEIANLVDIEMNSMSTLAADGGGLRFPQSSQFHISYGIAMI